MISHDELTNDVIISSTDSLEKHLLIVGSLQEEMYTWSIHMHCVIYLYCYSIASPYENKRVHLYGYILMVRILYLCKMLSSSGWTLKESSWITVRTAFSSPEFRLINCFSSSWSFCHTWYNVESKILYNMWMK